MKHSLPLLLFVLAAGLIIAYYAGCQPNGALSGSGGATTGPSTQRARGELRTVEMELGGQTFTLEVADTEATRTRGLMRRTTLPANHGMIFVFPGETERSFWMRNTAIPLDIVYVSAAGRIVSIRQMKPFDESGVHSDGPAKYAIELYQGTADRIGLKAGDALKIPREAANTPW